MKTIYIYVLDTLADWELGYVTAELNSRRFFKEKAPLLTIKIVGHSKKKSALWEEWKITPECLVEDIEINNHNTLLLLWRRYVDDLRMQLLLKKRAFTFSRRDSGSDLWSHCSSGKLWNIG